MCLERVKGNRIVFSSRRNPCQGMMGKDLIRTWTTRWPKRHVRRFIANVPYLGFFHRIEECLRFECTLTHSPFASSERKVLEKERFSGTAFLAFLCPRIQGEVLLRSVSTHFSTRPPARSFTVWAGSIPVGDVRSTVPRHLREVGIPPSTPLLSNGRARGFLPREAHWWTDPSHPVHRTREVACLSSLLFRICLATIRTSLPFAHSFRFDPSDLLSSPFDPWGSVDLGLNPSILPTPDGIEPHRSDLPPLPVG